MGVTQTASSLQKWIPFKLACRLRCLQQGTLNVGNTQQNITNLLNLCVTNANGAAVYAKWNVLRVAGSNAQAFLLVYPANVPGFVSPPQV